MNMRTKAFAIVLVLALSFFLIGLRVLWLGKNSGNTRPIELPSSERILKRFPVGPSLQRETAGAPRESSSAIMKRLREEDPVWANEKDDVWRNVRQLKKMRDRRFGDRVIGFGDPEDWDAKRAQERADKLMDQVQEECGCDGFVEAADCSSFPCLFITNDALQRPDRNWTVSACIKQCEAMPTHDSPSNIPHVERGVPDGSRVLATILVPPTPEEHAWMVQRAGELGLPPEEVLRSVMVDRMIVYWGVPNP